MVKLTSGDSCLFFFFFLVLGESIPKVGVGTESHYDATDIKQGLRNINNPKSQMLTGSCSTGLTTRSHGA